MKKKTDYFHILHVDERISILKCSCGFDAYTVTPLIFASHYFRECPKFVKLNGREYVFLKKVFIFLFF